MTTERRRADRGAPGFTLLEVLAGVLVLGLLYTVLATAAMRGLSSEGHDRRRAEASLRADRELALIESSIALGIVPEVGVTQRDEPPYRIEVEVAPEDVMAMMPPEVRADFAGGKGEELATLLVDDQGLSRIQRVSVVVEWEEGLDTDSVERTTWGFDQSALAALFPAEGGEGGVDEALTEEEREQREQDRQLKEIEEMMRARGDTGEPL